MINALFYEATGPQAQLESEALHASITLLATALSLSLGVTTFSSTNESGSTIHTLHIEISNEGSDAEFGRFENLTDILSSIIMASKHLFLRMWPTHSF